MGSIIYQQNNWEYNKLNMNKKLTKTDFILYRECHQNVWIKWNIPEEYGKFEVSEFEKYLEEKTMSRAAKGHEKYGKEGMQALAKAGKEGKDLDKVRDKYNKYDEAVMDTVKSVAKKVGKALTGGSDQDQLKNLQKKMGVPQTGKKPISK